MSKYTTELRFICEHEAGLTESVGYNDVNEVIAKARPKIFDFEYPIFDPAYKSVLETKILRHFYTREIGAEVYGLWHLWLETKMNEIMPYYNRLYESQLLEFNPFYEVDYTKTGASDKKDTGTRDIEGNQTEIGTVTDERTKNLTTNSEDGGTEQDEPQNDRWDYYSDTPQGEVNGLANNSYLTNARHIVDDATGSTKTFGRTNETTETGTDTNQRNLDTKTINTGSESRDFRTLNDYTEHVVGKMSGASYSKLLEEFRKTFLNIDMLVIRELNDLFFNLW